MANLPLMATVVALNLTLLAVLAIACVVIWRTLHHRARRGPREAQESQSTTSATDLYDLVGSVARDSKAVIQMLIGVVTLAAVAWRFFVAWLGPDDDAAIIEAILAAVGIGLAAAAAVELAYTLFTDGPDEALDPLLLAVAAAIIIDISQPGFSMEHAWIALLLGAVLAGLFAVRLFLAERKSAAAPNIWWIRRTSQRLPSTSDSTAPGQIEDVGQGGL